jgi:hypothetical protein
LFIGAIHDNPIYVKFVVALSLIKFVGGSGAVGKVIVSEKEKLSSK